MNYFSLLSFCIAFGVLAFGLVSSSKDVTIFADSISVFIVVGGTFAATSISFRMDRMMELVKVFAIRILKGKYSKYDEIQK